MLTQPNADSSAANTVGQRHAIRRATLTENGTLNGRRSVGLAEAQRDHRDVRDREREQRPEREQAGHEPDVATSRRSPSRSPTRRSPRCTASSAAGAAGRAGWGSAGSRRASTSAATAPSIVPFTACSSTSAPVMPDRVARARPSATPARTADTITSTGAGLVALEGVDRRRRPCRRTTSRRTGRSRRPRRRSRACAGRGAATFTSPARPDAASTPVVAAVAMPSANSRFSHVGSVPRSTESISSPGSHSRRQADHDDDTTTGRGSRSRAGSRAVARGRQCRGCSGNATQTIAAAAISSSTRCRPAVPQNADR